jgi:polysaccharide pyruvyl transferase WcaK-like protein
VTAITFLSNFTKIWLREPFSENYIKDLNNEDLLKRSVIRSDIALGFSCKKIKIKRNKVVFLNFREWKQGDRNTVISKAIRILSILLNSGFEIEFISTCQGIGNYTNDSILHGKIVEEYIKINGTSNKIYVNKAKYSPNDLIEYISLKGKFYIGMRLHMAISSIIAGVPILNFGYEPKNKGVLGTIGLGKYSYDIFDNSYDIDFVLKSFLSKNYLKLKEEIESAEKTGNKYFEKTFQELFYEINKL